MQILKYVIYFCFITTLLSCGGDDKKGVAMADEHADLNKPIKSVHITTLSSFDKSNQVNATGRIKKSEHYDLSFPLGGTIDQLLVKKGSWVVKGKQLARIKPVSINSLSEQSSFGMQQLNAKLESLNSQLSAAQNIYDQNIRLREEDIVSGIQLINSRLKVEALQEAIKTTQLQKDITVRDQNILEERKSLHILSAPVSGNVIDVSVQSGEQVGAGQPIITIKAEEKMDLFEISVSDRQVIHLSPGDGVEITLDAYPDQIFNGLIHYLSPEPVGNSAAYDVEVAIVGSSKPLIAGLFGHASINTSDVQSYNTIPLNSLYWADESDAQVLLCKNDTAVLRNIKVDQIMGDRILVRDGLSGTDQVILNANGLIIPGDRLQIITGR